VNFPSLMLLTIYSYSLDINISEPIVVDKFSQYVINKYYDEQENERKAIEARLLKAKNAEDYLDWGKFESKVIEHCSSVATGYSDHAGVVGITLSNGMSFTSIEPKMNRLYSKLKVCMGSNFKNLKFFME